MNVFLIVSFSLLGGLALALLYHEGLLKTPRVWILSAVLLLVSLGLRLMWFDYETLDYQNFLARWAAFFRQQGGFSALKYQVGNYNIPYLYFLALFSYLPVSDLYLIKLLSVLFDVLLAWSAARLTAHFTRSPFRRLCCFFTVMLLPTVFFNGAVWGQCDSLYVMPLLLGLDLGLRKRPVGSVILAAVAFGFKLQAVFVLPVWLVLWMTGKIKARHLLLFPVSYVVLVLPSVLLGRPFWETVTLYFSQTGSIGSGLNYNSPSIFAIFWHVADTQMASVIAIIAAFLLMANLLGIAWIYRERLSDQCILALALLFAIGIPFLLPHMHDRYFYAADLLSVVLSFSVPLLCPTFLLVQFASLLGYHAYLKMQYLLPMSYGSAALIVAFALALIGFLQGLRPVKPRKYASR